MNTSTNSNISQDFILAGKAIFTVSNDKGEHHTFKVVGKKSADGKSIDCHFVSLLTGADNMRSYTYVGMIRKNTTVVVATAKTQPSHLHAIKVVNFAIRCADGGSQELPVGYALQHIGKCGRCGKPLTTPKSLFWGLGESCLKKVMPYGVPELHKVA